MPVHLVRALSFGSESVGLCFDVPGVVLCEGNTQLAGVGRCSQAKCLDAVDDILCSGCCTTFMADNQKVIANQVVFNGLDVFPVLSGGLPGLTRTRF
ncbi:hypothetical protein AS149_32090 [Burkholderia cenocepacia]|nr:hypothetical protein AS149_32090 [Burkholderia cenocepacia]